MSYFANVCRCYILLLVANMIQVILAKPRAEVSKEKRNETYRKWLCNTHLNLLSVDFSIYWNLYFLFTFLLKSLPSLYISSEISTFSLLFYWNLYFLFTFLLKSLLSFYFSIEISAFSSLFYWNLYFLFTFLMKSLLSLYFSIEISTFFLLFYWNLCFLYCSIETSPFSLLF